MKLYGGIVINVINQLILKTNQNILKPNLKHKEKFSVVVEGYEFITLDINKVDYIIINCARDCYKEYFHTFKFRCIYDIEMTNGDCVNGITSDKKF